MRTLTPRVDIPDFSFKSFYKKVYSKVPNNANLFCGKKILSGILADTEWHSIYRLGERPPNFLHLGMFGFLGLGPAAVQDGNTAVAVLSDAGRPHELINIIPENEYQFVSADSGSILISGAKFDLQKDFMHIDFEVSFDLTTPSVVWGRIASDD